jgi:hypothetical protein
MQHADQHIEAIRPTVRKTREVSCDVFDDKVKPMGTVRVAGGTITIKFIYLPGMVDGASRDFIVDAISLALKECWNADQDSFDPNLSR